jgi:hypothetical protein
MRMSPMASIQITDLNVSESELLYDLTDEQILEINGGGWFSRIFGGLMVVVGIFTTPVGIGVALIGGGSSIIAAGERSGSGGR